MIDVDKLFDEHSSHGWSEDADLLSRSDFRNAVSPMLNRLSELEAALRHELGDELYEERHGK